MGLEVYLLLAPKGRGSLLEVDSQERRPSRRDIHIAHPLLANQHHAMGESNSENGLEVGSGRPVEVLDDFSFSGVSEVDADSRKDRGVLKAS